jgi:hypothetical protein
LAPTGTWTRTGLSRTLWAFNSAEVGVVPLWGLPLAATDSVVHQDCEYVRRTWQVLATMSPSPLVQRRPRKAAGAPSLQPHAHPKLAQPGQPWITPLVGSGEHPLLHLTFAKLQLRAGPR